MVRRGWGILGILGGERIRFTLYLIISILSFRVLLGFFFVFRGDGEVCIE